MLWPTDLLARHEAMEAIEHETRRSITPFAGDLASSEQEHTADDGRRVHTNPGGAAPNNLNADLIDLAADHVERAAVCLHNAAEIVDGEERRVLQCLVHDLRIRRRAIQRTAT